MHFLCYDGCTYLCWYQFSKCHFHLFTFCNRQVVQSNGDHTLFIYRYRLLQFRNLVFFFSCIQNRISCDTAFNQICILMMTIHMEDMIGWGKNHLLSLCENNRLQYIYHLCNTCHLHTVTVFVEDIQAHTCNQCISHGILLIEESRIGSRFHTKPTSPFVYDHTNLLLRIILIHNRTMTFD